jgi:hypothetical protein
MFKSLNVGVRCKLCTINDTKNTLKNKKTTGNNSEFIGFTELSDILKDDFEIYKMCEGTNADFAIKPKNITQDKLLPIQLKTTLKPSSNLCNNYAFSVNRNYDNMLIILYCISDKRTWLFDSNDKIVRDKIKISIGQNKSIFEPYEVNTKVTNYMIIKNYINKYTNDLNNSIIKKLMNLYNNFKYLKTFNELNIPIAKTAQREQEYRRFREEKFPYLKFEYPQEENMCYDFIINNFKVQEKVASILKKRGKIRGDSYIVYLRRQLYKYQQGDNDFYLILLPDKEQFYLFPESILLENNLISNKDIKEKILTHLTLYPKSNFSNEIRFNWLNNYLFKFDDVTEDIITEIFTTGNVIPNKSNIIITKYEFKENNIINHRKAMAAAVGIIVRVYDKNNKLLSEHDSICEASRFYKYPKSSINKAIHTTNKYNNKYWNRL